MKNFIHNHINQVAGLVTCIVGFVSKNPDSTAATGIIAFLVAGIAKWAMPQTPKA